MSDTMVVINEAYINQLIETAKASDDKVLLKDAKRLLKAYKADDRIAGIVIWTNIERHLTQE